MSERRERPFLKFAVVLGTVSVLGLFLGWYLEKLLYGDVPEEDGEVTLPAADTFAPPERQSGPTLAEQEVVRRATNGLPMYPNAEAHALAADFLGPNVPIAAAWFQTSDSPDTVLNYFVATFTDGGIPWTQDRPSPNGGYVAYMVPTDGTVRSVTATRQGEGTVVLLSNGTMQPLLEGKQQVPPNVPLPEEALNPMVIALNQEASNDVTVSATVPGQDVAKWAAFFEQALPKKGWQVSRTERVNEGEAQIEAVQSGQRSVTYLRRDDEAQNISILVRLSQVH